MRIILALLITSCFLTFSAFGQNYTSAGSGNWTTAANWTNTSGNGAATPSITGGYGTRNLNHSQTISGNYSNGSATLNISSGNTLTVTGNFTAQGGSTTNISGTFIVEGQVVLNGRINILPGGQFIARNNLRINSSDYLYVGTNVAPPQYADLVVYGDINSFNSGDIYVRQNGRVAIFGDVNDNGGGGTILSVSNGAQMYIDGDINYSGGGSNIQNNNSTDPYGLYVNGTVNNTGGGATTTTNVGDREDLTNTNPDFTNWLSTIEGGPLPIVLKSFQGEVKFERVVLNWVTAKEENFSHFEVERSTDQKSFEAIGFVQGLGESLSDVSYDFTDNNPPFGNIYYRLKSVDIDDSYEYSPIIQVKNSFEGKVNVSPNPISKISNVKINLPTSFNDKVDIISIYDLSGTLISQMMNVDTSSNLELNEPVKAGMYIIKVQHNGLEENLRLLVQ